VIDYAAVDMAATLIPFDRLKARQIAEVCARDWVANKTAPQNPMAAVKAAILSHHRGDEQHAVRLARANRNASPAGNDRRALDAIVGVRA
jgi:hypothetical protein